MYALVVVITICSEASTAIFKLIAFFRVLEMIKSNIVGTELEGLFSDTQLVLVHMIILK